MLILRKKILKELNIDDRSKRHQEDCVLWECVLNGDEQALEQLFRRHYPLLYDYGIKLSQQVELTKDSIQEVFTYIWEKRSHLTKVDSIPAYLLVAFRRHLLNALMGNRKLQATYEEFSKFQEAESFSFEDLIILREIEDSRKQALHAALRQIPPRIREALYLKTYGSLTYQEIAKIMNISPQVARNYVSEAFHRLRLILKNFQQA